MSSRFLAQFPRRMNVAGWVGLYLLVYLAASYLDLWSTGLALRRTDAFEANVFANEDSVYSATKAWAITALGGIGFAALFAFGATYARRVSDHWLDHPFRSFLVLFVNPWSPRVIDRTPLRYLAYALAFVMLRLLATGNNLLIASGETGPLGSAVGAVGARTSPAFGFISVIGLVYMAMVIAFLPVAARLLRQMRAPGD